MRAIWKRLDCLLIDALLGAHLGTGFLLAFVNYTGGEITKQWIDTMFIFVAVLGPLGSLLWCIFHVRSAPTHTQVALCAILCTYLFVFVAFIPRLAG